MVSQTTRTFTYLILPFLAFTSKTWSSLLPNTSLNIEPALTNTTLSVATGSSNANYAVWCAPPLSTRGPFLDRFECRLALTQFYQRFPHRTRGGQNIEYTLTHSPTLSPALNRITCPYVIAYSNCVFTLDYQRSFGGDQPHFHTNVAEFGGKRVVRSCVGKAPQEMVDGGEVTWTYVGTIVRISLAHTAMPYEEMDGNVTTVGNGSAALVSGAESNLTFSTDFNGPADISDSK